VNKHGQSLPNYHYEDLIILAEMYIKRGLLNPAIIVDTNHANSGKQFKEQSRIALEVLQSRQQSKALNQLVKGFMIESFIVEGAQSASANVYGQSITDPCLGWDDSEALILKIADIV